MPYRKTYDYHGNLVSAGHAALSRNLGEFGTIAHPVPGWMLSADAMKLYELAFFAGGDILELGTGNGLSAAVIAEACSAAASDSRILTIERDVTTSARAAAALADLPGRERITFATAEAGEAVSQLASLWPDFALAFIDHGSEYQAVLAACRDLHRVVALGGFCLFREFNDPRNADPRHTGYAIYQAVMDGLRSDRFAFWGTYGSSGLFRRVGPC